MIYTGLGETEKRHSCGVCVCVHVSLLDQWSVNFGLNHFLEFKCALIMHVAYVYNLGFSEPVTRDS